jgi:hypothetical protein
MGSYEGRLARLERRLASIESRGPSELPTLEQIREFGVRLGAQLREAEAEDARRKLLPLEEQIELLEADRERHRDEHANRKLPSNPALDSIAEFGDKVLLQCIAQLRQQLSDQRSRSA